MGQRARAGVVVVVKTFILPLLLMASIGGCAAEPQPILTPVEVKVPVATPVYCKVTKLDRPELPIAALNANSAPPDTMRAYAATVAILKGAVRDRDLVIEGCAPPASDQQPPAASEGGPSSGADEGAK
jgi:hypothetical protein